MNTIWLTADWHFGHHKLIEKGYRPENYEDCITQHLLQRVRPGDCVICLGDVHLYPAGREHSRRLLAELGRKAQSCLLRGNHDSGSIPSYLEDGWGWVCDSMDLTWGGLRFTFSHEPRPEGDINVHGHLHAGEHRPAVIDPRCVLISMELTEYRPVSLQTIHTLRATPEWHQGRFRAWCPPSGQEEKR